MPYSKTTAREVRTLRTGWHLKNMLDVKKGAKTMEVTVPHTWNVTFQKAPDGTTLTTQNGSPIYERAAMCYSNTISLTKAEMEGKRAFLYFEGVNSVAEVFVNHKPIGSHKGGYTAFCLEMTGQLHDGDNLIEVFCSNAWRSDVLPISGDFNVYGGIHRPCRIILTSDDCIRPDYYASPGVFIHQYDITEKNASVIVQAFLSLKKAESGLTLRVTALDAQQQEVASATKQIRNDSTETVQLNIAKPHLWQAKRDPYLYTFRTELLRDGKVIDEVVQQTGLRTITVDPNRGTLINGKHTPVYGFCRHDDVAGRGSALLPEDYQRDMDLILESGATAMRLAHYPHGETIYDLADRYGIILWTELPFCGPGGMAYAGYLKSMEENARQTVWELVMQKYNHPSICFWGIFNEVLTDSGKQFYDYGDPIPLIKQLNQTFHRLDNTRPTAFATCVDQKNYEGCADLIGWNKYFGWYSDATTGASRFFDKAHSDAGSVPVGVSEYGAGASPNHHLPFGQLAQEQVSNTARSSKGNGEKPAEAGPIGGLRSDSHFHPEEAQCYCHEGNWQVFAKRPWLWCEFIWLFADIQSYQRTEGEHDGFNDKGLLSYDRQTKKDAFYFYKAQWAQQKAIDEGRKTVEEMVYITSRRFTQRTLKDYPDRKVDIKIYTTLPEVSLFVNGKRVGKAKADDLHRAIFTKVQLQQGTNVIRTEGGKASDECIWEME